MIKNQSYPNTAFIAPNATIIGDVDLERDVNVWYGAVIRADKDRIVISGSLEYSGQLCGA